MYATTPEESGAATGLAPDPQTVEGSAPDTFMSGDSPFWKIATSASQGGQSSLGPLLQGERFLAQQQDAIRKIDPAFADKLRGTSYGGLPDIQAGMASGSPSVGTFASHLMYFEPKMNLTDAIEDQKAIEKWRLDNQSNPAVAGVPNISQGIDQVKNITQMIDQEAAEAQDKLPGVNVPLLGKITGPGLGASVASGFSLTNPVQLAGNLFFGLGGTIPKTLIAGTGARIAANAVTNGVIGSAGQAVLANPLDKSFGLPTMSAKEQAYGFLANSLLGGTLSGIHEAGGRYFPQTTLDGMQDVKGAMDGAVKQSGSVGEAARDIMGAENPADATAAALAMPLEQKLDLLHEVSPKPSTEERGVLQAGERDLMLEKTLNEGGMSYAEGAPQAAQAENAIENGAPHPATEQAATPLPTLPDNLAGAKPRYGYGDKQFAVNFESDIDKALYITAQANKSKADAGYRAFLQKNGYGYGDIVNQGQALKDRIKAMAKDAPAGQLDVPAGQQLAARTPLDKVIDNIKNNVVEEGPRETGAKYPVQKMLRDNGGVKVGSVLDQEMRTMGVNPKNAPGLFKKGAGLGDVDNFPVNEWKFGHAPDDGHGYVDRQYILDQIREERAGNPVTRSARLEPEHITPEAVLRDELDRRGIDYEKMSGDEVKQAVEMARLHDEMNEAPQYGEGELEEKEIEAQYQAMQEKIFPTDKTAAGEQAVIPGAEKIGDRALAERNMQKPLRSDKTQKAADDGLFDVAGRGQNDLFDNLKGSDKAPLSEDKSMTVKDAIEEIQEHEGLLRAMTTCFRG